MSRYIDADALERIIRKRVYAVEIDDILADIDEAPTIDIVRCGECKYWEDFECKCDWASTDQEGGASYSLDRDADDFCSYGEREGE